MTTLVDRHNTALLVVDMQNAVVTGAHLRNQVVANISALVEKARNESVLVIWVQHASEELIEGTPGWEYVPELTQRASEPMVHKQYGDSFEDTDLEALLAQHAIGRLMVAGAQTDACIRSTLHGAFVRGYDTILVSDAHTTEDLSEYGAPAPAEVIAHTNLYWSFQSAPGRIAATIPSAEVEFGV